MEFGCNPRTGAIRLIISVATGTAVQPAVLIGLSMLQSSGSSKVTTSTYLGFSIGKQATKVVITLSLMYPGMSKFTFSAVPVFPPTVYSVRLAFLAVPSSTTFDRIS